METLFRLARIAYPVTALGPGRRLALWSAGCPLNCPGCITPELRPPNAGQPIAVTALARHILHLDQPLDGVTFTGGEPLAQAGALGALWALLQAARPAWDLIVFSGYPKAQWLRRRNAARLLAATDLLIAGPYRPQRPGRHPLQASANQRLHALSARGEALRTQGAKTEPGQRNLGMIDAATGWLIGIPTPRRRPASAPDPRHSVNP